MYGCDHAAPYIRKNGSFTETGIHRNMNFLKIDFLKTNWIISQGESTNQVGKTILFQSSFLTALGNFAAFSGMASKINQKYLIFASTVASMSLDLRDYIVMVTFCLAVMSKCNSEEY